MSEVPAKLSRETDFRTLNCFVCSPADVHVDGPNGSGAERDEQYVWQSDHTANHLLSTESACNWHGRQVTAIARFSSLFSFACFASILYTACNNLIIQPFL